MKERAMKIGDEGLGDEDESRTVGEAESRWGRGKKKWEGKMKKEEKPEREIVKKKERENIF